MSPSSVRSYLNLNVLEVFERTERGKYMDARNNPTFAFDYKHVAIGQSLLVRADAFEWLSRLRKESLDGMVLDPPYGAKEYELDQIEKMLNGGPGIWRIPPTFDGCKRAPLPRFTALVEEERETLRRFFKDFAIAALPALKPGAHVFMASNSFLSQLVFGAIVEGGFEFRTEIIRLVQTLRGGDRPKLGEKEWPDVCSLPRGGYEPWGLFRKPLPPKMTIRECLKVYGTGGLRRKADGNPFSDVIPRASARRNGNGRLHRIQASSRNRFYGSSYARCCRSARA